MENGLIKAVKPPGRVQHIDSSTCTIVFKFTQPCDSSAIYFKPQLCRAQFPDFSSPLLLFVTASSQSRECMLETKWALEAHRAIIYAPTAAICCFGEA